MRASSWITSVALCATTCGALLLVGSRDGASTPLPESFAAPAVVQVSAFGQGPARFEPNRGQAAASVGWIRRGPAHTTLLTDEGFTTVVSAPAGSADDPVDWGLAPESPVAVGFRFVDPDAARGDGSGERRLPSRTHYLRGADESKWIRNVPQFAQVRLHDVWTGIDVLMHGRDGRLEYDFVVAPGVDPRRVAIDVEGADEVHVNARGDLVVHAGDIEIRHERPVIYQQTGAGRRRVAGRYLLESGHRVHFEVARYDPALELVIDPTECVGRRFGGVLNDEGIAIAVDPNGRTAVGGRSFSGDFTGTGALAGSFGGSGDAFVQYFPADAFTPPGTSTDVLIFIGTDAEEAVTDLQFGPDGTLYMTGYTRNGGDFPQAGFGPSAGLGGQDGFFAGVAPSGEALTFSRLIGGDGDDLPTNLELRFEGFPPAPTDAYIGMLTQSTDVPMTGTAPGGNDPVVLRFDPDGNLVSGVNLGGAGNDAFAPVRVDVGPSDVAVSFATDSNDISVSGSAFETTRSGTYSAVIQTLDPTLGSTLRSTFVNSSMQMGFNGMDRTADGRVFLAGLIFNSTFDPTPNAFQDAAQELFFGVVFALEPDLTDAPYRSYVSAPSFSNVSDVLAPDPASTTSAVLLLGTTRDGLDPIGGGAAYDGPPADVLLLALEPDDYSVPFLGHFGGDTLDVARSVAPVPLNAIIGRGMAQNPIDGNVLIVGRTDSPAATFPLLVGDEQGELDAFAFPFDPSTVGGPPPTNSPLIVFESSFRGKVKDSPKPNKDSFSLKYEFEPTSGLPIPMPGPDAQGAMSVVLRESAPEAEADTIAAITIPLNAIGWKVKAAGAKLIYKSPRGEMPKVKAAIDTKKRRATVSVSQFEGMSLAGIKEGRALADVFLGAQKATARVTAAEPRNGKSKISPAPTGLVSTLSVLPKTQNFGESFDVMITIDNHELEGANLDIELRHQGVTIMSFTDQNIDAREPLASVYATRYVSGGGFTSPVRGRNQKVDLVIDGKRVRRVKVNVK